MRVWLVPGVPAAFRAPLAETQRHSLVASRRHGHTLSLQAARTGPGGPSRNGATASDLGAAMRHSLLTSGFGQRLTAAQGEANHDPGASPQPGWSCQGGGELVASTARRSLRVHHPNPCMPTKALLRPPYTHTCRPKPGRGRGVATCGEARGAPPTPVTAGQARHGPLTQWPGATMVLRSSNPCAHKPASLWAARPQFPPRPAPACHPGTIPEEENW